VQPFGVISLSQLLSASPRAFATVVDGRVRTLSLPTAPPPSPLPPVLTGHVSSFRTNWTRLVLQVKDAGYYMCKDRINDLIIAPVLRAGTMNAILGCQVELPAFVLAFVLVCTPVPCEIAQRMHLVVVSKRILLSFCPGPAHPRARRDAALLRGARPPPRPPY